MSSTILVRVLWRKSTNPCCEIQEEISSKELAHAVTEADELPDLHGVWAKAGDPGLLIR